MSFSVEGRRLVDNPGEEALAERAVGDEPDAELFAGGEDPLFRPAPPQRVLALDGGDRLHGIRLADGYCGCFGHAEVAHLVFGDRVGDRAGDVFDGDLRVDPV